MKSKKEIMSEIETLGIKSAQYVCKDAGMGGDDYKMEVYAEYLACGDMSKALKIVRDSYSPDGYLAGKCESLGVTHTKFQKTLTGFADLSNIDFAYDKPFETIGDYYSGSDTDYFDENTEVSFKPADYYIEKDRKLTQERILERIS
jgi:hypothetical protein